MELFEACVGDMASPPPLPAALGSESRSRRGVLLGVEPEGLSELRPEMYIQQDLMRFSIIIRCP